MRLLSFFYQRIEPEVVDLWACLGLVLNDRRATAHGWVGQQRRAACRERAEERGTACVEPEALTAWESSSLRKRIWM